MIVPKDITRNLTIALAITKDSIGRLAIEKVIADASVSIFDPSK